MSRMHVGALVLALFVTALPSQSAHAQHAPPGSLAVRSLAAHALLGESTLRAGSTATLPIGALSIGAAALALGDASKQYTQTTTRTHNDLGLILAGSILLGVGYITSVVFGVILPADVLFIPVIGGVVLAPLRPDAWGLGVGLGTVALEAPGLALLLVGIFVSYPDEPTATSWMPRVVGGPGEAGAGLRWAF